ncbi:DUF3141 [Desulfonema limicola]|uniref:DUF3141 n=1 Tax=Desulfonema limicola TaxID=45656 RepID=A0A975GG76_9BACT|nr:DUF3141 domain-containing protein [Desulfonema limicola]QTA79991.1 DUF3141 [Desulfonema limicola]
MNQEKSLDSLRLVRDFNEYWTDALQRTVLFTDILRKRGNDYLDNTQKGLPPILTFDYEVILDGRSLDRPVNHDLVRIIPKKGILVDPGRRPVVIIDPRAGHGPGIGGSKRDSEIGMAMKKGHPVYFILFYPDPEKGQTYEDVKAAQIRFIEEVKARHPDAEDPAIIGNCQAGWAVALLSAERPDVTGPIVFNGSPLSYWAGVDGKNPMRYKGGLFGGIWLTSMLCDLGNGKFDGANLVMNFEGLNPANTYWTKQYNVWANVDKEEERYLNFEKWWNSYFMMNTEEIHFILKNLFVGNKLEQGRVAVSHGKTIDLKNLEDPVMVFASQGDNITPPQQALNWIAKVYENVDEIRRCQQVIVYRIHEDIGHLGIFVSGKVAQKEHKEIIDNMQNLEFLPPGLYEMLIEDSEKVIEEGDQKLSIPDYNVRFIEREISDILAMDDGFENEEEFETVLNVSDLNELIYQTFLSPWIKLTATPYLAEILKQLHPMRVSRYGFSDKNPLILPFKIFSPVVKQNRKPVSPENLFLNAEKALSNNIITALNCYRDIRDNTQEFMFKSIYGSPFMKMFFSQPLKDKADLESGSKKECKAAGSVDEDKARWIDAMEKGGITEGLVRAMISMIGADHIFDEREFKYASSFIRKDERFKNISLEDLKQITREQSRILQTDETKALNALSVLLPKREDRELAYELAQKIAHADLHLADEEKVLLNKMKKILKIR